MALGDFCEQRMLVPELETVGDVSCACAACVFFSCAYVEVALACHLRVMEPVMVSLLKATVQVKVSNLVVKEQVMLLVLSFCV